MGQIPTKSIQTPIFLLSLNSTSIFVTELEKGKEKRRKEMKIFNLRFFHKELISSFLILLFTLNVNAQNEKRSITVRYTDAEIIIDGVLDEPVWDSADVTEDFWQFFPSDTILAHDQTSAKMLYSDDMLYVGIHADVNDGKYVVESLRRDFGGASNDNVTMMFDTFNDGSNAFMFGTTPYGVKRDALVSGGGATLNTSWDVKWYAESSMNDEFYTVEIGIPLSSVKYREGETKWNAQVYRWDIGNNEQSAWANVPQNQQLSSLAFSGELDFENPLGKSHTPISIIPYINAISEKSFDLNENNNSFKYGGDAKVAIGNSLNLDITVNPDFSNVEVDNLVTNLTRFEVFLPEKRQFFMDNSDLFSNFGSLRSDARPFFSRRIGLTSDIIGGVRLSGKIGDDWRIGFLNMQTSEDIDNSIASNNNMMFALQKKVFSRSNIGVFFINRETFSDYDFLSDNDKYNRVFGIDYNLASMDNKWSGKFYLHKSIEPDDKKGNFSSQAILTLNTRYLEVTSDWVYVDRDFRADMGFVPRVGYVKSGNSAGLNFYPESGSINTHSLTASTLFYWNPYKDFQETDHTLSLRWRASFKDQSTLTFSLDNNFTYLPSDFDPTRTVGGTPLPAGEDFSYNQATASYASSRAKTFSFDASSTVGEFYNGNIFSASGGVSMRFQPWVLLTLDVNYDGIRLPEPYSDANFWLISPKVDVTFSKSIFWSTLVQYSNQRENLGINSRLQWRYAPLSDLYLVYNDNYSTDGLTPKFRSINLKLTYWLNI